MSLRMCPLYWRNDMHELYYNGFVYFAEHLMCLVPWSTFQLYWMLNLFLMHQVQKRFYPQRWKYKFSVIQIVAYVKVFTSPMKSTKLVILVSVHAKPVSMLLTVRLASIFMSTLMPPKGAKTFVETQSSSLTSVTTVLEFSMTDALTNAGKNQIILVATTQSLSRASQSSNQLARTISKSTSVCSQSRKNPSRTPWL